MLFYSDVRKTEAKNINLGDQNYSYQYPSNRIMNLVSSPIHLFRPEIYQKKYWDLYFHGKNIKDSSLYNGNPIHISFRPFKEIRFLKGGINIAHVAWEFSEIFNESEYDNLINQLTLIRRLDEIWTPSNFAVKVLQNHVDIPVRLVPTPIAYDEKRKEFLQPKKDIFLTLASLNSVPLSIYFGIDNRTRHQNEIDHLNRYVKFNNDKKIFIMVVNPGDFRKNMEKVIRGFCAFSENKEDVILLIKLAIDNKKTRLDNVQQDTILPKFKDTISVSSDKVIFISDNLSEGEMCNLYKFADFYISLSFGEGQNLPLLESMGFGVVPISVNHTAMSDYIDEDNSILISSNVIKLKEPQLNEYSSCNEVAVYDCHISEYINSLEKAYKMSQEEFKVKSVRCQDVVKNNYSCSVVSKLLTETLVKEFVL